MEPIKQTIHLVDQDNGMCMVMSGKGNLYPVSLNHYCKEINPGDTALVVKSAVSKEWLLVDVENKYPRHLDITEFPKDENNCLNWVEYHKYLDIIKDMPERERVEFDNHLKKVFKEKYGMKRWDTR